MKRTSLKKQSCRWTRFEEPSTAILCCFNVCLVSQAFAEAYAAKYSKAAENLGSVCTCPARGNTSSEGVIETSAVCVVDEVATAPFLDNELFMLFRRLELQLGREENHHQFCSHQRKEQWELKEVNDAKIENPTGQAECDVKTWLEALHLSQACRVLADQSLEKGQSDEAARFFDEAYSEGHRYLPERCA